MLGNLGLERLRDGLPLDQDLGRVVEGLRQDEANPGVVRDRDRALGFPLVVSEAQQTVVVGVVGLQARGERLQQHGHTEERPGHFDQGEPFSVVTSDGHGSAAIQGISPVEVISSGVIALKQLLPTLFKLRK